MCLRIYIRFLPSYIIIAIDKNCFTKQDAIALIIANSIPLPYFALKYHQDDFSGLFGVSSVQVFFLLILIIYAYVLVLFLNKKIKIKYMIFCIVITFILLGLGEIKIGFALIPIVSIIEVVLQKFSIKNIFLIVIGMSIMSIVGLNILIKVSPDFKDFFQLNQIKYNATKYVMKTNNPAFELGRVENIIYTNEYILYDVEKKLYGLGVGSSMPSENWYYEYKGQQMFRKNVYTPYETDMYKQYGYSFGYQFSSMNIIYMENGIIGFIIFYMIIFIIIKRSFVIIRKCNNINHKCIANSMIGFMLCWIPLNFYYAYLIDRNAMYICIILSAIVTNIYSRIK
ncbi:hypothetical protein AB2T63_09500 [Clostridium butyricum]|uniref:hypothetical protein n=1 Tax=Clostridium butyricum TaxID=1492 RepID=UPI003467946B